MNKIKVSKKFTALFLTIGIMVVGDLLGDKLSNTTQHFIYTATPIYLLGQSAVDIVKTLGK